jgi:GDP-4-dehydro-6-deoxy-D-mannose reductase
VRVFVTGGQGFVGTWLQAHLREAGDDVDVADPGLDIADAEGLRRALVDAAPDAVYHLAAFTHVGQSWDDPREVFRVNAEGTLNLLEAARGCPSPPRVLVTSSAEVYGAVKPEHLPLTERSPLLPVSPYAASKVASEFLGVQAHLGHGLPVIRARAFNHVGPGQAAAFAVSALAKRIVEAERVGGKQLPVGNLRPRRDFTDVRDVVRAYRLLVLRGEAGGVYNVCSGADVAIEEIAHRLLAIAGSDLELVVDPALERPADVPVLRGDSTLLRSATGWSPEIPLDTTLRAVVDHWRTAGG